MSRQVIPVIHCDRCSFSTELRDGAKEVGWTKVRAAETRAPDANVDRAIGVGAEADDLCPGCANELFAWWLTRGKPVEQPAAATRPAARPKPVLNLEDRKRAIAHVVDCLKVRTEFALQVVRSEPTAILSGEMIPGTLFGIEDSAEGIVDAVLDHVGFEGFRRIALA